MSPDTTVILSPHFDDAVLSCWHRAGERRRGARGERLCGRASRRDARLVGSARGRERFGRGGPHACRGGPPGACARRPRDRQPAVPGRPVPRGRPGAGRDRARRCAKCSSRTPGYTRRRAWATHHRDHTAVRAAALALHAEGADVTLYADLPHATDGRMARGGCSTAGLLRAPIVASEAMGDPARSDRPAGRSGWWPQCTGCERRTMPASSRRCLPMAVK